MIPTSTKALYGLPAFAVGFVTIGTMNFVLPYYTTELGLSLGMLTLVFVASRALDLFTDPLVGALSDRTRSRFGRRKPWIAAGVPVLMIGAYMLFRPPVGAGLLYFTVWVSVLFLGITLAQLPFVAWGAEMSLDYDEKTRIAGWREGFTVIGNVAALALVTVLQLRGTGSLGPGLDALAVILVVALPVLFGVALLAVKEAPLREGEAGVPFREGMRAVAANEHFRRYALGVFLLFFGIMPGATLGYYVFDHLVGRGDLYAAFSLEGFVGMLIGLPFWVWFAGWVEKHRAVAIGLGYLAALAAVVPFWFMAGLGHRADAWFMMVYGALQGLGFGAAFVLPYTLLADIIESDTARTGQRRSALFTAFAGMILKLALTIGLFVTLGIPAVAGFAPDVKPNTPEALGVLSVTFGWLAALLYGAAVPVFWGYGLSRDEQSRIVAEVEARTVETTPGGPLPSGVGAAGAIG